MNIFEKILAISTEVTNIEKDMTVKTGTFSYKAISDKVVTLAVKKAEANHKVVSIPIKQEIVKSEVIRTTKTETYNGNTTVKETITYVDDVKMTVRIYDVEKPTDYVDIETFGKGIDTGDKGFGKASTYARKYALLNAYKIATGDDPDKDPSPEPEKLVPQPIEVPQITESVIDDILLAEIKLCDTQDKLKALWDNNTTHQAVKEFKTAINNRKKELQ